MALIAVFGAGIFIHDDGPVAVSEPRPAEALQKLNAEPIPTAAIPDDFTAIKRVAVKQSRAMGSAPGLVGNEAAGMPTESSSRKKPTSRRY